MASASSETQVGSLRVKQREATKAALLDAALASLIENGYAATTTRGVAERAGVSQGAQQHHYPTKAALVDAAMIHLAQQVKATLLDLPPVDLPSSASPALREAVGFLLDTLWLHYNSPIVAAMFEFIAAARTDSAIAGSMVDLIGRLDAMVFSVAQRLVPQAASRPGAEDWLRTTTATIRGAALYTAVPGGEHLVPRWEIMREHILTSFDALMTDPQRAKSPKSH